MLDVKANISVYGILRIQCKLNFGYHRVEARGNSSVEATGNSSVKLVLKYSLAVTVKLWGYSVCWKPVDEKIKVEVKSKTAIIQEYKQEPFLTREGIEVNDDKVILYKRVSKDFKTQEGTTNETTWTPGASLTHPAWNPDKNECGEGKYHAVSRPYFGDEFRTTTGDKYVALKIKVADLYEWPTPEYPHKIAFREGTVLCEVNKLGIKL